MSLGVLGGLGAMLAITGIFGMAAYSVSKRLREFGIRVALGAQRKQVCGPRWAVRPNADFRCGRGITPRRYVASKVLSYIVYQATPRDPLVLAGVVFAMLLVGLLAAWVPALRALATDPSILLREE